MVDGTDEHLYDGEMSEGCVDEVVSLDDLVDALGHLERFSAMVAFGAAQLNNSGVWAVDGSVSMAAWLRQHARLSHRDASRLLKHGKFLHQFDAVGDAAVSGVLSSSQVAALRAVVSSATGELFEAHQHGVVNAISSLNAADTEIVCQQWRNKADAVIDRPAPKVPERSWSTSTLEDGTMVGRFVFDPTSAELLETALQTARCWDGTTDTRTTAVRNVDAIVEILAFFNANNTSNGTRRHHPHVELHIQAGTDPLFDGCAITANGRLLPSWATDVFMCDCVIHRVMRSGAAVLDYGRKTYTVPRSLWRAVAARDGGCRFPGCNRKRAYCDAHHIRWWRKHGETKLDNLLMLCNRHHHLIHRDNWQIALDADTGEATFTTPDGRTLISKPPGIPTIRAA
jgi:Domain of unknown function (DUF222)